MEGDLLSLAGRIEGLDPNKRYRLDLSPPGNQPDSQLVASKEAAPDWQLGVFLPDASGNITVETNHDGLQLAAGHNQVMGRTLVLSEIGVGDAEQKSMLIARGLVKVPDGKSPVQPSKLDDIEPGEVWF